MAFPYGGLCAGALLVAVLPLGLVTTEVPVPPVDRELEGYPEEVDPVEALIATADVLEEVYGTALAEELEGYPEGIELVEALIATAEVIDEVYGPAVPEGALGTAPVWVSAWDGLEALGDEDG